MELILVRRGTIDFLPYRYREDRKELWPFALPRDIYHQIQKSGDSVKTAYLERVLFEYVDIFSLNDSKDVDYNYFEDKYDNRFGMQIYYTEIAAETNKYLLLLQEK